MSDRWVVDASVIAKLYLRDEEYADVAERVAEGHVAARIEIFAPQLILYEVPNAILAAARRRRISSARATRSVNDFFALAIPTLGDDETLTTMIDAATEFAGKHGCSLYDAIYLVTAKSLEAPLLTADRKLYRNVSDSLPFVTWIADYKPSDES